jgi:hypothetical protein
VSDWVVAQESERLGSATNAKFASPAGLQWPNKELELRLSRTEPKCSFVTLATRIIIHPVFGKFYSPKLIESLIN